MAWMGMLGAPGCLRKDLYCALAIFTACKCRRRPPEDSSWHVTSSANGDHEVGLEVIEDPFCILLA